MNKVSEAEAAAVDGIALEEKLAAEFEVPFSELTFATQSQNGCWTKVRTKSGLRQLCYMQPGR